MLRFKYLTKWIILMSVSGLFGFVNTQNWVLSALIPKNYNKFQVPLQNNSKLAVNSAITINSFAVTEKTQTVKIDFFQCLNWTDYRLQSLNFSPSNTSELNITENLHMSEIKLTKLDSFWKPLLYFRNSIDSSVVSPLNKIEYMQIWPDKKLIKYCARLSVTFICHMEFANFPFDEHYCNLELESFEKIAQQLNIRIVSVNGVKGNTKFRIRNTYTGRSCDPLPYHPYEMRKFDNDTKYKGNCALATVRLVRSCNYYIMRYYCPTFLMVVMGMASFWMPTNAWPARIILTASVLLTLITTSLQGYNESPSNDVTSMVWWLWVCQFFIYMSMVEYAFALSWQYQMQEKKLALAAKKEPPKGHFFGNNGCYKAIGVKMRKFIGFFFGPIDHHRDPINRNLVDYFARLFYPFMLFVFVIVYIIATLIVWSYKWRW